MMYVRQFIVKAKNRLTKKLYELRMEENEGFRIFKRFYFNYEEIIN